MAEDNKKASNNQNFWDRLGPILLIAVVALAFVVGTLWQKVSDMEGGTKLAANNPVAGNNAGQPTPPAAGKLDEAQAANLPEVTSEDHVRGAENPEVYLIEYSDYECPYCSRFHPTAQQAIDEYGGEVAWVYRHFPLDSIHPKARPAANAAECAAELGGEDAFWAFTDAVFEDQTLLNDLPAMASDLGVNQAAFENCIESGKYDDLIDEQMSSGASAGVTGTPGNYLVNSDGEVWKLPGAVPFSSLQSAIDEALAN